MLKRILITITLTFMISFGCSKSDDTRQVVSSPKYAAQLICYIGKIGSGSNCSMVIYDPNIYKDEYIKVSSQSMKCGTLDQVSDIRWEFIEHSENNDIYNFTRIFPSDANEHASTTKVVKFNGNQTVIFEDEYQTIILDTPK